MDLWKGFDKVTALFKQSSVKILMLDFDGTLVPIVQSPEEAKLSIETRNLLQKLCQKHNLYLVIISGRELEDIKKKIGLPDIIYGGNHGLEGEIFHKKYSYPIASKTVSTLKKIQKSLDKIASQFAGVIIEDKGIVLSFHYRLVGKKVPEVKSLFKKTLKPYIKDKSISIIAGKMVFDIRPKVNWNKGSFAELVINQIFMQTKTIPVVIFIGDDKTDEDVFRIVKKGITIKVGGAYQSSANYTLKNTNEVFKFLKWVNIVTKDTGSGKILQ